MNRYPKLLQVLSVAVVFGGAGLAVYTVQTGAAPWPATPGVGPMTGTQPTHEAALQVAQATQGDTLLPGGASALNETYQDWLVTCASRDNTKRCALSQSQVQQQTGQRVLLIELNAQVADMVEGILVLPFGLALERGAVLSIDDVSLPVPLRFRTCLPAGCILPMSFDASTITALKSGALLSVATLSAANQEQLFSISLQGFAAAYDRLGGL